MKKTLSASLIMLACTALVSCSSMKSTTHTAKTLNIYGSGVIQKPVIVELDVKQAKVTATVSGGTGSNIETLKSEAVSAAVKNANADVLIEPTYDVVTDGRGSTVTVTGFPGTYKNFRDIRTEDVPLIQAGILQVAKVAEPTTIFQKKLKLR